MSHYEPCCKPCNDTTGISFTLERDPGGCYACPSCGREDYTVTSARAYVHVTAAGMIADEGGSSTSRQTEWEYLEHKFKQDAKSIMNHFLGIPDPRTSIIGIPGNDLLSGVEKWFEKMREVEREYYGRKNRLQNPNVKRLRYMIASAIKMSVQESVTIVINNRLTSIGIKRKGTWTPGFTKGDFNVPNVRLEVLFARANSSVEGSFTHLGDFQKLSALHRRFTKLLHNPFDPLESTLFDVLQMSQRLRQIVETPHEQRGSLLLTRPLWLTSHRDWNEHDFEFFAHLDWDKALRYAYQLYQMQRSVYLWGTHTSPAAAIALTIWAMQAVQASVMPQRHSIMQELGAPYGHKYWTAGERTREMQNLLIAWSTSIPDAGLPFPVIRLPPKGGLGDGLSGYNGDKRRPIPDNDIAATVAPVIAQHWRTILRARCRTRTDTMSIDNELWLSRKLFVISAACHDSPVASAVGDSQTRTKAKKKPSGVQSTRYKKKADEASLEVADFEPLRRIQAQAVSIPRTATSLSRSFSSRSSSAMGVDILHPSCAYAQGTKFVPPPEEPTVEDLLAVRDASSDEGSEHGSSEDEGPSGVALSAFQIGLAGATKAQTPFAFTIGPKGFSIETQDHANQSTVRNKAAFKPPVVRSITGMPSTSSLVSSASSIGSDSGAGSASEAERAIQPQQARLASPLSSQSGATVSRSQSPLHAFRSSSRGLSPASTSIITATVVNEQDDAHVGLLVREREEYVRFRPRVYVGSGQTVGTECEQYIWKWVRRQIQNGSMPAKITAEYLQSIGIRGDPRRIDLGPWVESNKSKWSPVESLLRAGIKPKEFPLQHIPHSVLCLSLTLNNYGKMSPNGGGGYAPIGQTIDDKQLDRELSMLFVAESGEDLASALLSEKESKAREQSYRRAKIWLGDDEMDVLSQYQRKKRPPPPATSFTDEKEDEELVEYDYEGEDNWNEDDDETDTVASTGYTSAATTPRASTLNLDDRDDRREARHDIHRLRSTIRHSGLRTKSGDQMEALVKAIGDGEDDNEDPRIAEAMLEGLNWSDMGFGMEMEMDGEEDGREGNVSDGETVSRKRKTGIGSEGGVGERPVKKSKKASDAATKRAGKRKTVDSKE
ncbi:hypothetical protein IAR55_000778 [Kwoniella newhampshirensis]|uniref:TFIIB-type domain-containing protein n=1 Tax=Kwoniella newhampshirensis TaxID=1651941 RepID=A0AAW0Z3U8_9TREE